MSSTFFGLTIASSGLSAYQAALNTTANNISNVQTTGYTRQVANRTASDAIRVHAKYGAAGTGVTTTSITQIRNSYYDSKYWFNQSSLGLYETKLGYMNQIENYFIDDDTEEGFTTIFNKMFNSLDTLKNNASDSSTREQFISSAQNLCIYFNSVATGLTQIQDDCNQEIKSTVDNINSIAEKIALLNKQINVLEVQGGYANELRDQRALLVDELSAIVPVTVNETPVVNSNDPDMQTGASYYTVKINGETLVDTYDYETLTCVAQKNKINQSDSDGLYNIYWTSTGNKFNLSGKGMSGTLRGLLEIRDGNNGENFKGKVSATTTSAANGTKIKIENPSITNINAVSMAESGVITINSKDYNYSGFTFETDGDGNITSYTFTLEDTLSEVETSKMFGKEASIGTSLDTMGISYYMSQMNEFLRSFCSMFNDILSGKEDGDTTGNGAQDLNGMNTNYYSFFTCDGLDGKEVDYMLSDKYKGTTITTGMDSYYKLTAGNIKISDVCTKDPTKLATTENIANGADAYDLIEKLALLKSDTIVFRSGKADSFLSCIYSDISVDTQESQIFYNNFSNIASAIETQRTSVSGVDQDEEALDLVKFQNAYNLSSKMVSVLTQVYDKLIQETGV